MDVDSGRTILEAVRAGARSVQEISECTRLHLNTVRPQLRRLHAAGLVRQERAPAAGRGRPRFQYLPVPGLQSSRPHGPLAERLDQEIIDLLADGFNQAVGDVVAAAREHGAALAADFPVPDSSPDADVSSRDLEAALDGLGFDPVRLPEGLLLRRCPMLALARRLPEVSCGLHGGLIDARLAATGQHWTADLRPFDETGFCTVHLIRRQGGGDPQAA